MSCGCGKQRTRNVEKLWAESTRLQADLKETRRKWDITLDACQRAEHECDRYKAQAEQRRAVLKEVVDLLRTQARRHHENLEPVQELRVLKVLNRARAAIAAEEEGQ